jgi:hypothetical protein
MAVFFPFEIVRQIEYILSHHMPTLDLTQSATCIRFSVAVGVKIINCIYLLVENGFLESQFPFPFL